MTNWLYFAFSFGSCGFVSEADPTYLNYRYCCCIHIFRRSPTKTRNKHHLYPSLIKASGDDVNQKIIFHALNWRRYAQ